MTTTNSVNPEREARFNEILLAYAEAAERGEDVDRQRLLVEHPEFADDLAEYFAGRDQLNHMTEPLRRERPLVAEDTDDGIAHGSPPPANFPTGAQELGQLGDFQLIREIARGGMGVVYEAQQLSLQRRVALKVLPFAAVMDSHQLQRFRNEAQAAAHLQHPGIVPVYAVGQDRGVHFYAMQFIEGQSLAELIGELRRLKHGKANDPHVLEATHLESSAAPTPVATTPSRRPLSEKAAQLAAEISTERSTRSRLYFRRVASLARQAAEALDHAHEAGVIHRDIKPGNLLLDSGGRLWITDFGLASFRSAPGLTMTGEFVGTLLYTSPEQRAAKRGLVDHRTDIYSLGVTLYELVTLQSIFGGTDWHEMVQQIAFEEPRPPRTLDRNIPVALETIILKAIAKNPADRYASAQEMADDLLRFLDDRPVLAKRPTFVETAAKWVRRHKGWAIAGLVLLLLTAAGLGIATALIAREQGRTSDALRREQQKVTEAEASFRQLRSAVDFLVKVSEDEQIDGPAAQQLRRRLLEAALKYYDAFILQHGDGSLRGELLAGREHLQHELDELAAFYDLANLQLLGESSVQQELKLSSTQVEDLRDILAAAAQGPRFFPEGGIGDVATRRRQMAKLSASSQTSVRRILSDEQSHRFRQILLQLPGPHVFHTPEVLYDLGLTDDQKADLYRIQADAERKSPRPSERDVRRKGPPPKGTTDVWRDAVDILIRLLTPEQKARWDELTGEPFHGTVHFPPRRLQAPEPD